MPIILKSANKDKSLLVLRHRAGLEKMFIYSLGETIETKYWNEKAQRLNTKGIPKTQTEKNNAVNAVIERHETFLSNILTEYKRTGKQLTRDILYNEFEQEFKIKPKTVQVSPTTDFYVLIDKFIELSKNGNRTSKKGTKITPQRIQHYETFKKNLKEFRNKVDVTEVDINFYKAFISHRNTNKYSHFGLCKFIFLSEFVQYIRSIFQCVDYVWITFYIKRFYFYTI